MSRLVSVKNTGLLDIPAYGIMEVTDVNILSANIWAMDVQQPSGAGEIFYPNGPVKIRVGGQQSCQTSFPAWVKYTGGPPSNGDEWGPVSGSFEIQSSGTGFIVLGVDTDKSLAYVKELGGGGAEVVRFTVTTADCEADPKSASVSVDAVTCSGASVAVNDTITVYDKAGCLLNEPEADLAGRVGFATKLDDGTECVWEVFQMCCPTNQCS